MAHSTTFIPDVTPEITVSIVSMNNVAYLKRCLQSLYRHHPSLAVEVIVVFYRTPADAISEVQAAFPQIQVVISPDDETRGYGENQNLGLRHGQGKYSVILNDDIVFQDDALRQLRDYHCQHPEVGALLPKLLNEDGSVQIAIRGRLTPLNFVLLTLHLNPVLARVASLRPLLFDAPHHDSVEPVFAHSGTGAFFWVTSNVLRGVGYMDERYFLSPDDIDLSMRIARAGVRLMYVPHVAAIHTGSTTLSKFFSKVLPVGLYGVTEMFRTHYGWTAAVTTTGITAAFSFASVAYWGVRWLRGDRERARTMMRGHANVARFFFARPKSSKEIFLRSW